MHSAETPLCACSLFAHLSVCACPSLLPVLDSRISFTFCVGTASCSLSKYLSNMFPIAPAQDFIGPARLILTVPHLLRSCMRDRHRASCYTLPHLYIFPFLAIFLALLIRCKRDFFLFSATQAVVFFEPYSILATFQSIDIPEKATVCSSPLCLRGEFPSFVDFYSSLLMFFEET